MKKVMIEIAGAATRLPSQEKRKIGVQGIPLQIICRDFSLTPSIRFVVREYVSKLETFSPRIVRCEVTISAPHRHKHKGKIYHVSVHLQVPGAYIVVSREPEKDFSHENLRLAIHDAFRALDRRLEDQVRKMRRDVKTLESQPQGCVSEVFPELDYGFLDTGDGQEVYFHRNSLRGSSLEKLKVGTPVHFQVEAGEKGPQATFVRAVKIKRRAESEAA